MITPHPTQKKGEIVVHSDPFLYMQHNYCKHTTLSVPGVRHNNTAAQRSQSEGEGPN